MGKKFFEGTIPQLISQLRRLNDSLERIANALEDKDKESDSE